MKTYGQFCGLARALDLVGERWTLLIVRDLLLGPRRYTDLQASLRGVPSNLLAARLRRLEDEGLVGRRRLPPPAGSVVYELTDAGRRLEEPILALGRFGAALLPPLDETAEARPSWVVLGMLAAFDPDASPPRGPVELRVGADRFGLWVEDGRARGGYGPPERPHLVVTASLSGLFGLLAGAVRPAEAVAQGGVEIDGPLEELERVVATFGFARMLVG